VTVWLLRHGETVAAPELAIGWTDVELAPEGRRQAEALGEQLASRPLRRVYCSDMTRARETAELVARPHRLPSQATADLREVNFGLWEGRRLADLWLENVEEARAWEQDMRRLPASFGETFQSLEARVARFGRRLINEPGEVVVVAHRGPLAILHGLLTGSNLESSWKLALDRGSLIGVEQRYAVEDRRGGSSST
jgi:broad specificity phosphatase PhoE